jgi:hypothetical protein
MGIRYVVSQNNVTPTAGNDILTIVSPANRRVELVEVSVNGRGASSAAQSIEAGASTAGTTPGGAVVPDKLDPDSPAAASVVDTTWSVQPTMGTNKIKLGWNALGGAYRWVKPAGGPGIASRNGANISIRCPAAAPTPQAMDLHCIFEEI